MQARRMRNPRVVWVELQRGGKLVSLQIGIAFTYPQSSWLRQKAKYKYGDHVKINSASLVAIDREE